MGLKINVKVRKKFKETRHNHPSIGTPQDNLYVQSLSHKGETSGPRPAALSLVQYGGSEHRLCLDKIPLTAN